MAYYVPYDEPKFRRFESPQWRFHLSTKPTRLFIGANRIGKSDGGTAESCFHATGLYPEWYPKEGRIRPKMTNETIYGRILITDFKEALPNVLLPKLEKFLPKAAIREKPKKNPQGQWPYLGDSQ